MSCEITADDLVVFKEGKNIMSGGYKIDSFLFNNGISPMASNNASNTENLVGGTNVSSIFSNLAVPAGLLLLQQNTTKKRIESINNERKVICSDLYDKLLGHIKKNKRINHNRKTKTNKKSTAKKTRRKR